MERFRTWAAGLLLAAIFLASYTLLRRGASTNGIPRAPRPEAVQPDFSLGEGGLSKALVSIETPRGVIRFRFFPKQAPETSRRIAELVNQGFYDGLKFHRVVAGFVIQGGDPSGDGTGGSGQKLKAEFNLQRHGEGVVGMARGADPESADSQFYITLSPQPHLDDQYTIFGKVVEGMEVAKAVQAGDPMNRVTLVNQ